MLLGINPLVIQWLGFHASTTGVMGSVLGWKTKTPHAVCSNVPGTLFSQLMEIIFFFFGHAVQLAGILVQFPDQGWNPDPWQ